MHKCLLTNFNNSTLDYKLDDFPWNKLILDIIKSKYTHVDCLENIHTVLSANEIVDVTLLVQDQFLNKELSDLIDQFAETYIKPLIDNQEYLVKRQPTLNVVIPNQCSVGRRLPFHQGIFYDNGRGQGTIWMPLTECYDSNSMWVVDLEPSRQITKQVIENQWDLEQFENECLKFAYPVKLQPGQAHLFNQEIIHGNVNNTTSITRFALDWHVLIKGEEYHRRLPGGFFRMPGDYASDLEASADEQLVCYLSNNSEYDRYISKYLQRLCISDYLKKVNAKHNGYQFENEYLYHLPIFQDLCDSPVDGIVVFSMHSLSDDLIELALSKGKTLHFANELMILRNQNDLDKILYYKNFGVEKKGKLSFES